MLDGLVFVALFVIFGGGTLLAYWLAYASLPTFDEYRRRHPDLVKNGRCRCHSCGGDRVFLHTLDAFHRRHVCATCGTVLYRS